MKRPNLTAFLFVLVILAIQALMGLIIALIMDRSAIRFEIFSTASEQMIPALLLGAGMALIVTYYGVDFSIGGILSLSAVVMASLTARYHSFFYGVAVGIICALVLGAINGAVVAWLKMPGYITTLATWGISAHLAYLIAGEQSLNLGSSLKIPILAGIGIYGSTFLIVILLLPVLFFAFVRSVTYTGTPTRAGTFTAYVLSAWCAAVAAMVLVGQNSGAVHTLGEGRQWLAVAAAVFGGAFLFRGPRASLAAIGTTVLAVITIIWLKGLAEGLHLMRDQIVGVRFLPPILCGLVYALAARILFQPPQSKQESKPDL